ncbi:MAG TPA: LysM peptidoglycan-binding domain-containing protein [Verrucomicrobiota bacterium]|jgi:TolA-binding protein|nr:LysM peptidoglycan-binding domain-containing protein [Verrucomicrobiota bacterium]
MRSYAAILLLTLGVSVALTQNLFAQGDDAAVYYQERIRTLSSRVEELTQAHAEIIQAINKLQRQYNVMAEEVSRLREAVRTPPPPPDLSSAASLDSVKQLQAALVALENRFLASEKDRQRDNERLLKQLDKLAKIAPSASIPSTPKAATPSKQPEIAGDGTVYEWTVKEGETLSGIVKMVKNSGGNTSVDAILKANPGLNPNSMRVGRKIIIPELGK